jgi:hypothetical protein
MTLRSELRDLNETLEVRVAERTRERDRALKNSQGLKGVGAARRRRVLDNLGSHKSAAVRRAIQTRARTCCFCRPTART